MAMLTNPRPQSIKLTLSDGSERVVGPWGLALVPDYGQRGEQLTIIATEFAEPSAAVQAARITRAPHRDRAA